jgi:hypothetical protein
MWGKAGLSGILRPPPVLHFLYVADADRNMKALVDSTGFDIPERIAAPKGEISCSELRAKIRTSRPAPSDQFKVLAPAWHASG